ncbi:uncharacterized protein LOC133524422 [Cydia pomonella]|uniref:uncharacterized protein LOC133524422 n=1 Tax=Cydia pomonella TaxID=82600 RepID=UPI002ADD4470|nr:uncharacterized protein LOC133524422 [Cydia pomonella]
MSTQTVEAFVDAAKDLENSCTPTGKALTQFLQKKRNGAKLADILMHLKREFRNTSIDPLTRNMTSCLEAGTNYGFLERKGSRFCVSKNARPRDADEMSARREEQKDPLDMQSQPSDRCRRRRRRRRRRRGRRRRRSCRCPRRR